MEAGAALHQHSSRCATAAAAAAREREAGAGGMAGIARRSPRERMEKRWGRGREKREAKEEERDDDRGETDVEEERGFADA